MNSALTTLSILFAFMSFLFGYSLLAEDAGLKMVDAVIF